MTECGAGSGSPTGSGSVVQPHLLHDNYSFFMAKAQKWSKTQIAEVLGAAGELDIRYLRLKM